VRTGHVGVATGQQLETIALADNNGAAEDDLVVSIARPGMSCSPLLHSETCQCAVGAVIYGPVVAVTVT
jgi:hypothetical protein